MMRATISRLLQLLLLSFALITVRPCLAQTTASSTGQPELQGNERNNVLLEAFRVFGVERHELNVVVDDLPLSTVEVEVISKLIGVMPRIDWASRQAWQRDPTSWNKLRENINEHRWQLHPVIGRVTRVRRWPMPVAMNSSQTVDRPLYAIEIESADASDSATVLTRWLPRAWRETRVPENAPIQFHGILAKASPSEGSGLVFLTDRFGWYPNEANTELGVTGGAALLAQYGFDFNQLADLVQRGQLTDRDRYCFYEMLWAARRVPPSASQAKSLKIQLPIAKLLQDPTPHAAELYRLRGTARRVVLIRVSDPDIRKRYGIDHYYEVEMFLNLEPSLRLIEATDGSERIYHRYPLTVCCREVPDDIPQGDLIRQEIEVDAFLLKLWSYRSEFASGGERDQKKRQISPLLIAGRIRIPPPSARRNHLPAIMIASVVIGTAFVALILRQTYARGDRRFSKWRRTQSAAESVSFDTLEIVDDDGNNQQS